MSKFQILLLFLMAKSKIQKSPYSILHKLSQQKRSFVVLLFPLFVPLDACVDPQNKGGSVEAKLCRAAALELWQLAGRIAPFWPVGSNYRFVGH
jgi:hypothetical protein